MSEVLDFYKRQAEEGFSTIPWFATLQKNGLQALKHFGFPNRHMEDWKYTLVDSLLEQRFVHIEKAQTAPLTSDFPHTPQITVLNGQIFEDQSQLPEGVIVKSLENALIEHEDKLKPYLSKIMQHEHGFQALNTAFLRCGLFIYIPEGLCLEKPIVISNGQNQDNQAIHSRYLVIAGAGSQATIMEEFWGVEDNIYFTNTISEVLLEQNAKLQHYKVQREAKSAYHVSHLAAQLQKGAQFESHMFSFGGKLVRSDLNLSLQEENSSCLLNGLYVPTDGQHIDHHTTVNHLVPNCHSEQDYKGILVGTSRAVFNGKVIVAKNAQHTEARQQNKNVLLSKNAEINTKPQLEIFADDVICTHGATVGQLDEEALFYLATRGIDKEDARGFLIKAFAEENLRLITDKILIDWITELLNQQLR